MPPTAKTSSSAQTPRDVAKEKLKNESGVFVSKKEGESVRGGEPVKNPSEIDPNAKVNLGPKAREALEQQTGKLVTENTDNNSTGYNSSGIPSDEERNDNENYANQNDDIDDGESFFVASRNTSNLARANRLKRIVEELRVRKIFVDEREAEKILNSNFEVKFPWIMLFVTCSKYLLDILLTLMGVVFFVLGVGLELGSWATALIPFVGIIMKAVSSVSGLIMDAIGIIMPIISFIINVIYQGVMLAWGYFYSRSATDLTKHISYLHKFFMKFFIRRSWMLFFGAIPLVGGLVDIFLLIYTYFYIRKKVREIKEVVENN